MKNLLKATGIAIALTAIGVAVRANKTQWIRSKENKLSGGNVTVTSTGVTSTP